MRWNWQQPNWPNFTWNPTRLARAEEMFLRGTGVLIGASTHLDSNDRQTLTIEEMSVEALTTSQIEGEFLDRASVQTSLQRQLGLNSDHRPVPPAEQGIAELLVALYRSVPDPL